LPDFNKNLVLQVNNMTGGGLTNKRWRHNLNQAIVFGNSALKRRISSQWTHCQLSTNRWCAAN